MGKQTAISCGGTMNCWEEGEKVFFRVEFPEGTGEQYKVWLVGNGGNEMLLGTAGHQGDLPRLFRTMSRTQLKYSGCWPVQGVRVGRIPNQQRKRVDEWYCEEHPERFLHEDIRNGVQLEPMFCRQYAGGVELALPFSGNKPIGLNYLFCFAVLKQIKGKQYLVWKFDREGKPKIL